MKITKRTQNKIYPLAAYQKPTPEEREALGFLQPSEKIMVEVTGEFRAPKAGEWYISGAIIEGYRAGFDFQEGNRYNIARLVVVRREEYLVVTKR